MNGRFYQVAAAPFEAARSLTLLPPGHRARRLHGHSFLARVQAALPAGWGGFPGGEPLALAAALARCVGRLDYCLLDEHLAIPSDEHLARWLRHCLQAPAVAAVGIQSTRDQGVDLDPRDHAHLWRRFRFEAAHRLPRVAADHPCGRMHGHGFEVVLHAAPDPGGVGLDPLEAAWWPLQEELDGCCLNDLAGLDNPTSEVLSHWIWQRLEPHLPGLSGVTVYETASAGCRYDGATYRIWKALRFESALRLAQTGHRLHGHGYLLRLHLSAPLDTVMGWTVDYGEVKALFAPVYAHLDHHLLNDLPGLADADLGSLVGWVRDQAQPALPRLDRIDLYDTPDRGVVLTWGDGDPSLVSHPD
jgi:6-pyruvoyltetrahydropterin/6-carboxytetrahydropterin synthase